MSKLNVDLAVGASIIAALFILVAGLVWLKEASVANQRVDYLVIFPEVGTLQKGDPVFVNGVKKGTVRTIELRGIEVGTILNLDKKVTLTDSVQISVVNVGLLGERGIGVNLSTKGGVVQYIAPGRDTAHIAGKFQTGISEAMGMLGTVLAEVETLVVSVADILNATIGDTSFISQFHVLVGRLDTTLVVANRLLTRNEPVLNATLSDLRVVSKDLKDLVDRNTAGIDNLVTGGDQLMVKGVALVNQADSLVGDVKAMLRKIEKGEGSLGKLYKDEEFYTELKDIVRSLDTLVNEVQSDALKLRVRLGFGKKKAQ
ncbi:MAG: MlaD family protein [Chitinispirillia bacterium]|nr:MlaD family protein [Chitinispirillia bacterium]MCL2242156.1 MlaD family protein [Chitinispirillia bacterium]